MYIGGIAHACICAAQCSDVLINMFKYVFEVQIFYRKSHKYQVEMLHIFFSVNKAEK